MEMYSNGFQQKQISRILIQEEKKRCHLQLIKKLINELDVKDIYETFDYAEFLKNNENLKTQ